MEEKSIFELFFKHTNSDEIEALKPFNGIFSVPHIIFLVLVTVSIILLAFYLRKHSISFDKIRRYLIISSIIWISLEIIKIVWTYVTVPEFDALKWFLPFFSCSIMLYALPLAALGKGKYKKIGVSGLTTICLVGGVAGCILPDALNIYPFFSFGALHSLIYHWSMIFTAFLLLFTQYDKTTHSTMLYGFVIAMIVVIPGIIINELTGTDFFLVNNANNTPFEILGKIMPKPLFVIVMLGLQFAGGVIITEATILIRKLLKKSSVSAIRL